MKTLNRLSLTSIILLTSFNLFAGERLTDSLKQLIKKSSVKILKRRIDKQYPHLLSSTVKNMSIHRSKIGEIFEHSLAANFNEFTGTNILEGGRSDLFYMDFQVETKDGYIIDRFMYIKYSTYKRDIQIGNSFKQSKKLRNPDSGKDFVITFDKLLIKKNK